MAASPILGDHVVWIGGAQAASFGTSAREIANALANGAPLYYGRIASVTGTEFVDETGQRGRLGNEVVVVPSLASAQQIVASLIQAVGQRAADDAVKAIQRALDSAR